MPNESVEQNENVKTPKIRDLFVWESLNRPERTYSKEVFSTFGVVAFLISLILAFFQEWLAILLTWAAYFLFYALTKVPPIKVSHKITTQGIISMDHSYLWNELGPFWFRVKENETVLHIAHQNIISQISILIDPENKEKIQEILAEYLPFVEVPEKSLAEKLTDWFAKKFPIKTTT